MTTQQMREMILTELPILMRSDESFRQAVLSITDKQYADKKWTEKRFNHVIAQQDSLKEKEEKQDKILVNLTAAVEKLGQSVDKLYQSVDKLDQRLDKLEKTVNKLDQRLDKLEKTVAKLDQRLDQLEKAVDKLEKTVAKLDQRLDQLEKTVAKLDQRLEQKIAEDREKWDKNDRRWDKNDLRWDENDRRWDENDRRWDENKSEHKRLDQRLMAMGARWGTDSEASFRNALAGILKEFPGVEVIHADEHDDEGVVFGYPEEVELDVIIKNGMLMICELKSSVHKSDIYTFERKIRFYEQKKGRKATRKIVISPMVDKRALPVAKKLGMDVYSFADDVIL